VLRGGVSRLGLDDMSYYDLPKGNADVELGRKIYMDALSDRRGFRDDQIDIEDPEMWREIFEEMGKAARAAVSNGERK
jgi:hypothetical protein